MLYSHSVSTCCIHIHKGKQLKAMNATRICWLDVSIEPLDFFWRLAMFAHTTDYNSTVEGGLSIFWGEWRDCLSSLGMVSNT